jgi:hypothetical protein
MKKWLTLKRILLTLTSIVVGIITLNLGSRATTRKREKETVGTSRKFDQSKMRDYSVPKGVWSPKLYADKYLADDVSGRQVRVNGQDAHVFEWKAHDDKFKVPAFANFIEIRSTEKKLVVTGVPWEDNP